MDAFSHYGPSAMPCQLPLVMTPSERFVHRMDHESGWSLNAQSHPSCALLPKAATPYNSRWTHDGTAINTRGWWVCSKRTTQTQIMKRGKGGGGGKVVVVVVEEEGGGGRRC